jgi:hypothetical protein
MKLVIILLCIFLWSSNIGACEVESCLPGYRLSKFSCRCIPQLRKLCRKSCPIGKYLSSNCKCTSTKECGVNSCVHGYRLKESGCGCEKEFWNYPPCSVEKCFDGFELNNDCKCVPSRLPTCRMGCSKGYTIYPGTCECVPKRSCHIEKCEEPAYLNHQCECELPQDYCDIDCDEGYEFEFPCQCAPIAKPVTPPPVEVIEFPPPKCFIDECEPGLKLNKENCSCVEDFGPICLIGCPFGKRVYPGYCNCIEPYTCGIKMCKEPAYLNGQCECEPPADYCDIDCKEGTQFEFPCQCVPIIPEPFECNNTCEFPARRLDNCECEFPQDYCDIDCKEGTQFEFPCQCVPIIPKPVECDNTCKFPGRLLDNCECEFPQDYCDIDCKEGTQFEFPCQCVPINNDVCNIRKCKRGFDLNPMNCKCELGNGPVCYMMCPPGLEIYPGTCECVEKYKCEIESCSNSSFLTETCMCI